MRYSRLLPFLLLFCILLPRLSAADGGVFSTQEKRAGFAGEISVLMTEAWKEWQDAVRINGIAVDGARGILSPGDIGGAYVTVSGMLVFFDRTGRSQVYIDCVRAVAGALENGMRKWQMGYAHENIPFPRGASSTFTLHSCRNVPVTLGSGRSSGDKAMTEEELYNYMLYRAPGGDDDILSVFRASARAIAETFTKWKNSCMIAEIFASGGIAPQPSPMGSGPGPVKGAVGRGGRLQGSYFDGEFLRARMTEYSTDV